MSSSIQELLQNPRNRISYQNLIRSAKHSILYSEINFQGSSTTFHNLIGSESFILGHLTSDNILKILIDNEELQIGKTCDLNVKYGYFERRFMDVNIEPSPNHGNNYEEEKKEFEEIREIVEESKTFLLSDYAGSGKTASFKSFVEELKEYNENVWVSYVELRKHLNILDTIDEMELSIENVLELLMNIIETETELEKEIFKKLFLCGNTILLFDGFDEVSPKYTDALMKFFQFLDNTRPRNQFWISTRPHLLYKLKEVFDAPVYKFAPFSSEEKENLILTLLDGNNIHDGDAQKVLIRDIMSYLRKLRPNCCDGQDIDIFFAIYTISEYCIKNSIKPDDQNHYDIFAALVQSQIELNAPKIPLMERDKDSLLTIWEYHRIEAFPGPSSLSLKKKMLKDRQNWTPEILQRYGFMTDKSKIKSNNRGCTFTRHNFVHIAYASFFAAQFIINFIYDDNECTSDEDLKGCIKAFNNMIHNQSKSLDLYSVFLVSYFKSHGKDKIINQNIKNVIYDNIRRIDPTVWGSYMDYQDYAAFLSIDPEIAAKFFKLGEHDTLLDDYVTNGWMNYRNTLADAAMISLGPNWHQMFSNSSLISDEEIEQMRRENTDEIKWNQDKNLLKISNIYFKSQNLKIKNMFFDNLHKIPCSNGPIQIKLLSIMFNVHPKHQYPEKCLMKAYYDILAPEAVKFIQDRIEENFTTHQIKQIMFRDDSHWTPMLIQSLHAKDPDTFRITRDFYVKYKRSWNEIQTLFKQVHNRNFFVACTSTFYNDYKKFINEVFANDMALIIPRAQKASFKESQWDNIKDFECDNTKDFRDWILSYVKA